MPSERHLSKSTQFASGNNPQVPSSSATYFGEASTSRPSLLYLLFTASVNLNALSLLPPKVDGQWRRNEDKNKSYGGHIKSNKIVLKRKLNRKNRNENSCVLQLQRHCAFFFVILLVIVMMSFGDAGGIIEESRSPSNKYESTSSVPHVNGGLGNGLAGYKRSSVLGGLAIFYNI